VSSIVGNDVYFQITGLTADVDGRDQREFLSSVSGEPGFYGSYKRVWKAYGDCDHECQRTAIFIPSTMGLTVSQAWDIMRAYLADPVQPGCK
jgi:hypothetical protein